MRGKHRVIVQNNRLHYEFEIKRNITIIRGDSATGKTTLINMLRQAENLGNSSGIEVSCDVPCRILEGSNWKLILEHTENSIFFIDEENVFVHTVEFASCVKDSGSYFVLITRENLYGLPYSVEEIYGIHPAGKYQNTRKIYQQMYQIYSKFQNLPVHPDKIIVEDSNSGYEFFNTIGQENNILCESAGGKSNIFSKLQSIGQETVCVIADGAAIGPEMNRLYEITERKSNIVLYFPESFEWLILKSGLVTDGDIKTILQEPEAYIESKDYFSWERYFTKLLIERTQDTYLQYQKTKLNPVYLHDKIKHTIISVMQGIIL